MNTSHVWVEITSHQTNLNFDTIVSLNGVTWDVRFSNNSIRATSRKAFSVSSEHDRDYDVGIHKIMNQIVGHLRNLGYFAVGLDLKWGYRGGYGTTGVQQEGAIFPSIHQQQTNQFSDEHMQQAQKILKDIARSRKNGLKTMLNYWRRAKELDELGYDSEAFLNYYKIIECLAELSIDKVKSKSIIDRFCPKNKPQATLKRRYGAKDNKGERVLERQINFVAKALSTVGSSDKVSRGLFIKLLDCVFMRHGWNVAHKLVRTKPYDQYDAIGQHSDEFNLVMMENLFINKITKLMILLYVKPGAYHIDTSQGIPKVVHS